MASADDWQLRLRRAFEIPDIVEDARARQEIASRAAQAVGAPEVTEQALDIVVKIPELGAAGDLDGLLVPTEGESPPQARIAAQVAGLNSGDKVLVHILGTLREHLRALPYGDSGCPKFFAFPIPGDSPT